MKFAALCYDRKLAVGDPRINLGDALQTLAALAFLPRLDAFIDRDHLHEAASLGPAVLLANGNFSDEVPKTNLPPPANLRLALVSVRLNYHLLRRKTIAYLRQAGPVGCRDLLTQLLLADLKIATWWSGCLTLTLERPKAPKTDRVMLVDVERELLDHVPQRLRQECVFVTQRREHGAPLSLYRLIKRKLYRTDAIPRPQIEAELALPPAWAGYLNQKEVAEALEAGLFAKFRPHEQNPAAALSFIHQLVHAEALLQLYARASLVITSRLHCALPCLAIGVPVVLLLPTQAGTPSRFQAFWRFQRAWAAHESKEVNWAPRPPDISKHVTPLRQRCRQLMVAAASSD